MCVCLGFFCVYLVCLQPGQCQSKPLVCHSQCQASQRDPGTQRGLRRATDPPPALSVSLGSKASRPYRFPPNEEVFSSSACSPLFGPHARVPTSRSQRPVNCVLHTDRSSWCPRGPSFEITDNYKGPLLTGPCQYKFPLLISN